MLIFQTNGKLMVLGVPILKHFRVFLKETSVGHAALKYRGITICTTYDAAVALT